MQTNLIPNQMYASLQWVDEFIQWTLRQLTQSPASAASQPGIEIWSLAFQSLPYVTHSPIIPGPWLPRPTLCQHALMSLHDQIYQVQTLI